MGIHPSEDEECFSTELGAFLFEGVKILKRFVDTIEKSEATKLLQRDDGLEIRMNDAIFQINKEVDLVREMITLSEIDHFHSNLRDLDERLTVDVDHMKNVITHFATIAVVERDIQDIEKETNIKINKLFERVTRNERNTRFQIEGMYRDLYKVQDELVVNLESVESRLDKIEEKNNIPADPAFMNYEVASENMINDAKSAQ